jgi:hypothetical protein
MVVHKTDLSYFLMHTFMQDGTMMGYHENSIIPFINLSGTEITGAFPIPAPKYAISLPRIEISTGIC